MNKALHVLVYVFLLLAGAALYFELQLNDKRALLTDRNRMQEDILVKIAKVTEIKDPSKASTELKIDVSPVEAKLVDSPDMENILDEYKVELEQSNLETYNWETPTIRENLRKVYVMKKDEAGMETNDPEMDGTEPMKRGSEEDKLLNALFDSAKSQLARLNTTRDELRVLHGKLEKVVTELNELKPIARQDKVTIVEKNEKIATLEGEKADLEGQITKKNAEIDDLNIQITNEKDKVATTQEELAATKEELEKTQKRVEQLNKMMAELVVTKGAKSAQGTLTSLPAGDKGKIVEADNENMFAVIALTDEALKELKGDDLSKPLPILELGVKRKGHQGEAGEFVGRLRLRQEVKGKPYVICDILAAWEQDKLQADDVVFAD